MSTKRTDRLTLPLNQLMSRSGDANVALAGGKGASLGKLMGAGLPVPDGYVVTTNAYQRFIHQAGLYKTICNILEGLDVNDNQALATAGSQIRQLILDTPMPSSLSRLIRRMYRKLGSGPVGVRSSTSAEDGDAASYAGQQDTHLYITGASNVVTTVKMCFSSLWTDRAILYSTTKGIDHLQVSMAVVVQNMVSADEGVAGVMFTIDPNSGHPGMIDIGAVRGLGEGIVGGLVSGDDFLVCKASLLNGGNGIVQRNLGSKKVRVVRDVHGTRVEPVPEELQGQYCLTDEQVREIARIGLHIEIYYGKPMDVEWAIDRDGVLWILQARPETVASKATQLRTFAFKTAPTGKVLARGVPVGNMIGSGQMFFVDKPTPAAIAAFPEGAILISRSTDPTWLPLMVKAGGFGTEEGSRTSHVAIVGREMGKPAIVGIGSDIANLTDGSIITLSCIDGQGIIYEGEQPYEVTVIDPSTLPTTETKVMLNLADPSLALARSQVPNEGVGLLRMEFIIANTIGMHPMALLKWPNLDNPDDVAEITRRTAGYSSPAEFFVATLAEGMAMICAAVWPYNVIVRTSDFKTNEYRALIGGAQFEGHEENPMIAFRGCDRHIDPRYAPAFALECEAIRRVREDMALTNLHVMLPFIRTPQRGKDVIAAMAANGIPQGHLGLKVYAMMELPSNVIRAAEYAEIFDGFSIGSNDLTQLTLGIDRDSGDPILVEIFDEMDPAVLWGMQQAIEAAHAAGIPCGICGQGPSDRPELAAWLVERKIDSMSVLPDAVVKTREVVYRIETEQRMTHVG